MHRAVIGGVVVGLWAALSLAVAAAQEQPTLFLKPDCSDETSGRWLITAFGDMRPGVPVRVVFDPAGPSPVTAVTQTGRTSAYQASLAVPARPAPAEGFPVVAFIPDSEGRPVKGTEAVSVFRVPCTPPPTTTPPTSPSSVATVPPTAPPVTPPPTPARLPTVTVDPAVGSAGAVVTVTGTDFPPGPVSIRWDAGGAPGVIAVADVAPDGSFATQVLVLPNGSSGERVLLATGAGTQAGAPFLVVPGTQQPAGFVSRR